MGGWGGVSIYAQGLRPLPPTNHFFINLLEDFETVRLPRNHDFEFACLNSRAVSLVIKMPQPLVLTFNKHMPNELQA